MTLSGYFMLKSFSASEAVARLPLR